jgi:aspartyl-tRNA(Asn)/glutamyl-tRNA(Gln) amidotransferase subunit B
VESRGLGAITGGLEEIIDRAIAADPAAAQRVREGNAKALGPLVGFIMRETKGRADGGEVRRMLMERLGASDGT